jgi:hypothetical protein
MKPKQLDMGRAVSKSGKPRFEQVFHKDHRYCDCAMPMVSRKWNDALGVFVGVRLCCLARAVEKLTGQSLYEVFEFDPKWEWDCTELHESESDDGTVEMTERGAPPKWLLDRLLEREIPVHNLPGE